MLRSGENVGCAAMLNDGAVLHYSDLFANVRGNAKVVSYEKHRQLKRGAQLVKQVEHLLLHGHVQRGNRLIGDNQARVE